jgi:hypothetical protein
MTLAAILQKRKENSSNQPPRASLLELSLIEGWIFPAEKLDESPLDMMVFTNRMPNIKTLVNDVSRSLDVLLTLHDVYLFENL